MASNSISDPIGLVGTGLFGTALAKRMLAAGYSRRVHNRTRAKADGLLNLGAQWSENPLQECRRVVFCLFTTDQVAAFVDARNSSLTPNQILLDTSEPNQAVALGERLARSGVRYLEAPFSGSSEQARNHQATALVAGDKTTFDACHDLWQNLAAATFYLGRWGKAAKMKLTLPLRQASDSELLTCVAQLRDEATINFRNSYA